ncbi:DoxX family protein [Micromonospora sp. ATCC 39149]|nr:DoxX family protein [Micromonospora sp. ATCC 39149]
MTVTASNTGAARWPAVRPWLGVAVRLGLAAVWLIAGGAKVGDLAASGRAVNAYQVMPYDVATVIGAALPFVGRGPRDAAAGRPGHPPGRRDLGGPAGFLRRRHRLGLVARPPIDCGCFGSGGQLAAGQSPSYLPGDPSGTWASWPWPGSC